MRLFALTQQRAKGIEDVKMLTAIYAEKLSEYPADVVRYVLSEWPVDNTFWPSWHELHARLQPFTIRRRGMLKALENAEISDE